MKWVLDHDGILVEKIILNYPMPTTEAQKRTNAFDLANAKETELCKILSSLLHKNYVYVLTGRGEDLREETEQIVLKHFKGSIEFYSGKYTKDAYFLYKYSWLNARFRNDKCTILDDDRELCEYLATNLDSKHYTVLYASEPSKDCIFKIDRNLKHEKINLEKYIKKNNFIEKIPDILNISLLIGAVILSLILIPQTEYLGIMGDTSRFALP